MKFRTLLLSSAATAIAIVLGTGLIAHQPTKATMFTPIEELVYDFPLTLAKQVHNADLPTLLTGGDESLYWVMHTSRFLPTAILPVRQPTMKLPEALIPEIGEIEAETKNFGKLTLDDFLATPESRSQAFLVVHKGQIVYENYPRMRPTDHHIWMSNAKTLPSLVIDLLINEGKINQEETLATYIPEFQNTAWDSIPILDILDMTPGLNSEENTETRADPNSIATRTFKAEFGMPHNGQVENLLDVLHDAQVVSPPGEKFEYGSPTTQTLVYLAEAVENKRWSDIVEERIWSKIGAEAPLQLHTTPDGIVGAHGLISSRLRDMARFGMLYTPSWDKIATEQVVTPEIIARIRNGVRSPEFFRNGFDGPAFISRLNDDSMISNSRQWDAVWPDGDFWKSGLMSQGIYVSPDRDLVIVFYSLNAEDDSAHRYLRPIATSGLFDE